MLVSNHARRANRESVGCMIVQPTLVATSIWDLLIKTMSAIESEFGGLPSQFLLNSFVKVPVSDDFYSRVLT